MWRSFNVHHYGDRTDLILDAVRPLAAHLAPSVHGHHYLLHWLRGPHVRINIDADPEVFQTQVLPALNEAVTAYMADRPRRGPQDPDTLLAQHARLAELEHEPGPISPLHPDGRVEEVPYDRRLHVLGSAEAADLLADFYTVSTPNAFDMLEHVRATGNRIALAFDVMVATAHHLSGIGLGRSFVSFRSHAEAFLSWWPEADGLREAWDRHYAAHAPALAARVRALTAPRSANEDLPPLVHRWLDTVGPVVERGTRLIEQGRMSVDPPWTGRTADNDEEAARMMSRSRFHGRPRPEGPPVDRVWFDGFRLLLNYTYLQLTRLGTAPAERFLLCHLAANTAEDLFGVRAEQVRLPVSAERVRVPAASEVAP
ncbi:thiopeptide maturation pyridine synthase [Nocardiopsis xinjiangensis]|uniref:thiopeptide maturation pyridine synthase n=1 Tax=Nocardiopsis xinjiangensis TaxID=124285 RepID=UPI000349CBE5|nr:thiopeptide maturation pyridine synthase [Nocardiopsis xinjiangensis]